MIIVITVLNSVVADQLRFMGLKKSENDLSASRLEQEVFFAMIPNKINKTIIRVVRLKY